MSQRVLDALVLPGSPLVFVLSRVNFSTVLQIDKYVPDIQESLRKNGYPIYHAERSDNIAIGPSGPQVTESKRWLFLSGDQRSAVGVGTNFVGLETSSYTTFDEFSETLRMALGVVGAAAELELAESVALRYVDLLRGPDGSVPVHYMQESLRGPNLGFLTEHGLEVDELLLRTEGRAKTGVGQLQAKVLYLNDGSFLPPDIQAFDIQFDTQLNEGETVALIDIDHVNRDKRAFDPDELIRVAWSLHNYTDAAFRSIVTPAALRAWGLEEQ